MPRIIEYPIVRDTMLRQAFVSLYHNSGAFGFINAKDVKTFLATAGEQVGLGDWRPRFGRFSIA